MTYNKIPTNLTSDNSNGILVESSSSYNATTLPYKAFDGIANSANYWASAEVSGSHFILIDFKLPIKVKKYILFGSSVNFDLSPKDFTLQASNDKTNWTIIDTRNGQTGWSSSTPSKEYILETSNAYRYFKIVITDNVSTSIMRVGIDEIEFYSFNQNKILLSSGDGEVKSVEKGEYTENLIPTMTSNTEPSGVVSVSTTPTQSHLPFDGNPSTLWQSGAIPSWLQYKFVEPQKINLYTLTINSAYANIRTPKSWTFEGSNDGVNYTVLDTQTNILNWVASEKRVFAIGNRDKYSHYRLNFSDSGNGGANIQINEVTMHNLLSGKVIKLPHQTEQTFINHGMSQSDLASVDMYADFIEKHYIQDVSTVLGTGKVFEHTLDSNKVLKKITFQ